MNSDIENYERDVQDAEAGQDENLKLVPVSESIRYRRRAQSAEKQVEELSEQLEAYKMKNFELDVKLKNSESERILVSKLNSAGVIDIEAAVLLAKAKMGDGGESDLNELVEQLKKEKQYLFSGGASVSGVMVKTSGVRQRHEGTEKLLKKSASRAANTGRRTDLQEYLKLRRMFI